MTAKIILEAQELLTLSLTHRLRTGLPSALARWNCHCRVGTLHWSGCFSMALAFGFLRTMGTMAALLGFLGFFRGFLGLGALLLLFGFFLFILFAGLIRRGGTI